MPIPPLIKLPALYERFPRLIFMREQSRGSSLCQSRSNHPTIARTSVNELDLVKDLDFGSADIYVDYGTPMDARLRLDSMRNIKPGRRFLDNGNPGPTPWFFPRMAAAGWARVAFAFLNYVSGSTAILYWLWRQNRSGAGNHHQSVLYSNGQPTQAWGGD